MSKDMGSKSNSSNAQASRRRAPIWVEEILFPSRKCARKLFFFFLFVFLLTYKKIAEPKYYMKFDFYNLWAGVTVSVLMHGSKSLWPGVEIRLKTILFLSLINI